MGTVYWTKGKKMWLIKIDSKKKIKEFRKKIKSLYEKNKISLSPNKDTHNGKHRHNKNNS
tara:strand:- start:169 stop:348 length:180 start_codon:yes stop_codon:yes gene_type:complete